MSTAVKPAGMLPPWTVGDLPPPPPGGWRRWLSIVGPGVLLAGASIGSGEWLTGPAVTAQYGSTLLWLATLSILFQVFVNLEMIRYTLYCGEPIVVGFFRSWPGPRLWTFCYAALDFAAIWPFNVAGAAVALAALVLGHLPSNTSVTLFGTTLTEHGLVKLLSYVLFLGAFLPLIFGGTIYKMLLRIFTFKLVVVLVYLSFFAVVAVSATNAWEIVRGFFAFGKVPVRAETVIADRHFSLLERDGASTYHVKGTVQRDDEAGPGRLEILGFTVNEDGHESTFTPRSDADLPPHLRDRWRQIQARVRELARPGRFYVTSNRGGERLTVEGLIAPDGSWQATRATVADDGRTRSFDRPADLPDPYAGWARELTERQGVEEVNLVRYRLEHGRMPDLDWALLATLVAIAGTGGLTNTLYSSFARDKGWGMGARVGAIPSLVGGRTIALSHVGQAFPTDALNRPRWLGWMRYVRQDQVVVWMTCNFLGMALPCMLSLQFIRHAPVEGNRVAAMTAEGMAHAFPGWGSLLWLLTLFVGFLILYPGQILSGDQLARRWTDIIWSSSRQARRLEGNQVKYVYYGILSLYAVWGLFALWLLNPLVILKIAGVLMNVALGFSALHTLYVNRTLLPRELRPGWFMQAGLLGCGAFFLGISVLVLCTL
jgi:hypothetical protein